MSAGESAIYMQKKRELKYHGETVSTTEITRHRECRRSKRKSDKVSASARGNEVQKFLAGTVTIFLIYF